jgi:hypothetical protein
MRKTISVERVKEMVNDMILHTPDDKKIGREALGMLLENILHETGNYQGYNMLTPNMMKESKNGCSVGINDFDFSKNDLTWKEENEIKFNNTDHTRVFYY